MSPEEPHRDRPGRRVGMRRDDLVIALTYYAPYVSGLTNMARDIAEGLAARGKRVTVVTSRYDTSLPRAGGDQRGARAACPGARPARPRSDQPAVRAPGPLRDREGRGGLAAAAHAGGRGDRRRDAHPDRVDLPLRRDAAVGSGQHRAAARRRRVEPAGHVAGRTSWPSPARTTPGNSRMWPSIEPSMVVVPPPCPPPPAGEPSYRETDGLHVGFLGRIVREKGLEYLVRGFRALPDPDARLLIGGDFTHVAGGSVVDQVREAHRRRPPDPAAGVRPGAADRRLLRVARRVHAAVGQRLRGVRHRAGRRDAGRCPRALQRHPGRPPAGRADRFRHRRPARRRRGDHPRAAGLPGQPARPGGRCGTARTRRSPSRRCSTATRS